MEGFSSLRSATRWAGSSLKHSLTHCQACMSSASVKNLLPLLGTRQAHGLLHFARASTVAGKQVYETCTTTNRRPCSRTR